MKLIIDIDERLYDSISERPSRGFMVSLLENAILHGTPIPDNATNGDMLKAMFPNGITIDRSTAYAKQVTEDWWNAPYQKGDK